MNNPKRILIISAIFFPQPSVGAVRMTQWCRFLPEFGWQPVVLTRYYGYLATPELLKEKVHPEVRVEYFNPPAAGSSQVAPKPGWKQQAKLKLAESWLGQMPVPDMSVGFWRGVRVKALQAIQQYEPAAILTTSPPHAVHDLGGWLHDQTGIPWVADFRDPFLIYERPGRTSARRLRWRARQHFERQIYDKAALITHATPLHARWARMVYPSARERIVTIYNGFPPEMADPDLTSSLTPNDRRSVRVIGFMSPREVNTLASAVRRLLDAGVNLELRLVGRLPEGIEHAKQVLGSRLIMPGVVPHDEAVRQIVGADVLVCMADQERSRLIGLSTKMFEYIATGKPVIVLNPKIPDKQFGRGLQGVRMLEMPGEDEMADALVWALDPNSTPPAAQTVDFREQYNRRTQAAQLARYLSDLVSNQSQAARE